MMIVFLFFVFDYGMYYFLFSMLPLVMLFYSWWHNAGTNISALPSIRTRCPMRFVPILFRTLFSLAGVKRAGGGKFGTVVNVIPCQPPFTGIIEIIVIIIKIIIIII